MMIHIIKNKIKNKKLRDEIDLPEKIGGITLAFVFSKQENGISDGYDDEECEKRKLREKEAERDSYYIS
jgi:hypothetical protein